MKAFVRNGVALLGALTVAAGLTVLSPTEGWGQEKHMVSYRVPAANAKYTKQLAINVGDVPGHEVRVFELERTFPTDPPMFDGVKAVESWTRATTDFTGGNGRVAGYTVWVLANGDTIFSQLDGTIQTMPNPDGSRRNVSTQVIRLTGGTGRFAKIRGIVRATSIFDPKAGRNEYQGEGEYWMEK